MQEYSLKIKYLYVCKVEELVRLLYYTGSYKTTRVSFVDKY